MKRNILSRIKHIYKDVKIVYKLTAITMVVVIASILFTSWLFYSRTSRFMVSQSSAQITETIRQAANYINEKLELTKKQFNSLIMDENFKAVAAGAGDANYIEDFVNMSSKFERIRFENSSMVENILFLRGDDSVFYESTAVLDKSVDYKSSKWYKSAVNSNMKMVWFPTEYSDIYRDMKNTKVFRIVQEVSDKNFNPLGVLVMDIKEKFLADYLRDMHIGDDCNIYIIDKDKNIIAASGNEQINPEYVDAVWEKSDEYGEFEYNSDILMVYNTINANGWRIVAEVPKSSLMENSNIIKGIAVYIILLGGVLFAFLTFFSIRFITRPIGNIAGLMKEVQNGSLDVHFEAESEDEIGILGQTFNKMTENIKKLIEEVSSERELKTASELRALQSQINAHFLYNTLDTIYWMAKCGKGEEAADVVELLARFMRLGLNNGSDVTTVEKEAEHVKSYMQIQKMRFEEVDYSIYVDESIKNQIMPKLLVQPLVENSILHGLPDKDYCGKIDISFKRDNKHMLISVSDDGIGMDTEEVRRKLSMQGDAPESGYAIVNIYNRIRMFYKDKAKLEFEGVQGEGTTVTIILPLDIQ